MNTFYLINEEKLFRAQKLLGLIIIYISFSTKTYISFFLTRRIIDAVFSIGVNYTSTENSVKRFCKHFGVTRLREKELAPQSEQLSVTSFIQFHQDFTFQEMVEKVYQNKQRTSPRNGILKAEAAFLFAGVVQKFGVEYLQDVNKILGNEKFEADIARSSGQGSGDSGTGKAFDRVG